MAQLGIRDKNYRPNQYINPMLISGGREPNPEDKMYRIFDKTNPEHPDYEGNKDDDDGPEFEQLRLPIAKKNQSMTIAGVPNFPGGGYGSTSGAFVDLSGEAYFLIDGELIPQGGYDPAKHGDLIPHGGPDVPQAMNNQDMMIANFLTGKTGEGKTLSDEAYDAGYDTIMETTEPNSYNRSERLKILNHQYFDQI